MKSIHFRGKTIKYQHAKDFFDVMEGGSWEGYTFNIIDRMVTPGSVFVDVGAWIGPMSLYAGVIGAECVSIEPDLVAFWHMVENVRSNNGSFHPYNAAIARENGYAQLNTMHYFGNSESSLVDRGDVKGSREVKTYTLGFFLEMIRVNPREISLVKIDIEGGEIDLLHGAVDYIRRHKPPMLISFHPAWINPLQAKIDSVADFLFPIYEVTSAITNEVCPRGQFNAALINGGDHNFLFIAKP